MTAPRSNPPMFVRKGLQISAKSRTGWVITLIYTAVVLAVALGVFAHRAPPTPRTVAIWAIFNFGSALLFTVFAWRAAVVIDD
ncbi:hypothetical protein U1839_13365 [Sphingomonas sp. RT2P30]|uniref:hypothetical protein n=1 Tax=Parasphingomonas halimpatiens TaxID=3096162 RepID=UPI002FC9A586